MPVTTHDEGRRAPAVPVAATCMEPYELARDVGSAHRQRQSPPHAAEPFGLVRDNGRRTMALTVAATCRGAVRTRPRQREARTGAAGRRHMPRSCSDSPATTGGAHWQCQSPPHAVEPFGLARDNGRRAPALPVAATCRGAVRTRPQRREACTGSASRRNMPWRLARDNRRRAPALQVAATCRGAVRTLPRQREARIDAASRRHMPRSRPRRREARTGSVNRCPTLSEPKEMK
jgi:hypothetical protein